MPLTFEQAVKLQETYRASDEETLRRIGGVTLVAFVGPTAAGKNFNMAQLAYHQAGTLTNRGPRDTDLSYRYPTAQELLDKLEQGTLVQYAALPPDRFYASDADCYEPGVNVMDVTSVAVESLYSQGFGMVRPIGVLAYEKDWRERLAKRFAGMSLKEKESRLDDAEESISAIIDSWGDDRLVIVSSDKLKPYNLDDMQQYIATGEVRKRKRNRMNNREFARKAGLGLLSALPDLREQYLKKSPRL